MANKIFNLVVCRFPVNKLTYHWRFQARTLITVILADQNFHLDTIVVHKTDVLKRILFAKTLKCNHISTVQLQSVSARRYTRAAELVPPALLCNAQ